MNLKIGMRVKELRKKKDVTQEQLANALGVTNQAISRWESEAGYPDIEYIAQIAKFFEVTADYLLTGEVNRPPANRSSREQREDTQKRCSFCAQGSDRVGTLVAGPGVYICRECVTRCVSILEPDCM